jgi:hypothetical protein
MEKKQFKINDKIYTADDIGWEYAMQEGEKAGRSDDGSMWHDEIGMLNKVYYDFKDYKDEDGVSELINLIGKSDVDVTFYDLKTKSYITKSMYVTGDKITAVLINDVFMAKPFQIRIISNKVE